VAMFKRRLDELSSAVILGDVRGARKLTEQLINDGVPPNQILQTMLEAMRIVDSKYERKEYFVVEVAAAASAMKEAFKILQPHLKVESVEMKGKIVIGSLKGNIQGLGKDIVAAALKSAGFEVVDLGVDISPEAFVNAAVKEKANVIAISITMDETVPFLMEVIEVLHKRNLKDTVKVVIGGNAVSEKIREEYSVDAYAKDAWDCVSKVKAMLAKAR